MVKTSILRTPSRTDITLTQAVNSFSKIKFLDYIVQQQQYQPQAQQQVYSQEQYNGNFQNRQKPNFDMGQNLENKPNLDLRKTKICPNVKKGVIFF